MKRKISPQLDFRSVQDQQIRDALFLYYPDLEFFDYYWILARQLSGRKWHPDKEFTETMINCWYQATSSDSSGAILYQGKLAYQEEEIVVSHEIRVRDLVTLRIEDYLSDIVTALSELVDNPLFLAAWEEYWEQYIKNTLR